jgi:NhaP-type Na+/H+ or K+/H+ antiporter
MVALLTFAVTLLVAVLVSELAHRTVLSTAVLFLAAGFAVGEGALNLVLLQPRAPLVTTLAGLALFSVLFTDGMRVGVRDLTSAWSLPGRALLLGMPLALALLALAGHFVVGLPWTESFLLGAVLSPTDPVFAAAIVGREDVPYRLRHLLNVESGMNDGLALPVVVVLLAVVEHGELDVGEVLVRLALGVLLGVFVPWVAIQLERSRFFAASTAYEPLNAFAIGLIVLAVASLTGVNAFLAAFSAGVTIASMSPAIRDAFHKFGDLITELLKLAALMVLGIAIAPRVFVELPLAGWAFVVLVLLAVRPVAVGLALIGSGISAQEWIAAAWFGPKGFASVVYGLLILQSSVPRAEHLFELVAVVVTVSIAAHSSTDVVVARWFRKARAAPHTGDPP